MFGVYSENKLACLSPASFFRHWKKVPTWVEHHRVNPIWISSCLPRLFHLGRLGFFHIYQITPRCWKSINTLAFSLKWKNFYAFLGIGKKVPTRVEHLKVTTLWKRSCLSLLLNSGRLWLFPQCIRKKLLMDKHPSFFVEVHGIRQQCHQAF